jgi:hypothetical protein
LHTDINFSIAAGMENILKTAEKRIVSFRQVIIPFVFEPFYNSAG